MKLVMRLTVLAMVLALMLCAVGCKKVKTFDESETAKPSESTVPIEEGVEDWIDTPSQPTGGQQGTEQPTGGQQGTEQPTGGQQGTEQPTSGQQGTEPTVNQPTASQDQNGSQEQPTGPKQLTLKEYNALTTAQQQAYFESFSSPDAFYDWLEAAEKADETQNNTVTGDGTLDLNDYINK